MAVGGTGRDDMGRDDRSSDASTRILYSLRRIARALDIQSRKLSTRSGVTSAQLHSLRALRRSEIDTASKIAEWVHLSPSTVVGILDRLEEKDLVRRERSTTDRRVVNVTLTGRGRKLVDETPDPIRSLLEERRDGLTMDEAERIAESLERLVVLLGADSIRGDVPYGELPLGHAKEAQDKDGQPER